MSVSGEAVSAALVEVLLVEDNPGDVQLVRRALKGSTTRINLSTAGDGEAAMAFLRRQEPYQGAPRPSFVMLDLKMPRKDGYAVLQEMRNDAELRRIPVVIFTSSKAEEDVTRCYNLQANAYVAKPTSLAQYAETVKSIEDFWTSVALLPRR
jgi:two-component system, chemotaxis family, response regulator Rcp1